VDYLKTQRGLCEVMDTGSADADAPLACSIQNLCHEKGSNTRCGRTNS